MVIEIIIKNDDGGIVMRSESLSFESAQESLGKLERAIGETLDEKRAEEAEEAEKSEIEALDPENEDDVVGVGDEKVSEEE